MAQKEMYDAFISYEHELQSKVQSLQEKLERVLGIKIWRDTNIYAGEDVITKFTKGIKASKIFIACINKKYPKSKYCKMEINLAVKFDMPIIPIMFAELTDEDLSDTPVEAVIAGILRINLYKDKNYDTWTTEKFDQICVAIKKYMNPQISKVTTLSTATASNYNENTPPPICDDGIPVDPRQDHFSQSKYRHLNNFADRDITCMLDSNGYLIVVDGKGYLLKMKVENGEFKLESEIDLSDTAVSRPKVMCAYDNETYLIESNDIIYAINQTLSLNTIEKFTQEVFISITDMDVHNGILYIAENPIEEGIQSGRIAIIQDSNSNNKLVNYSNLFKRRKITRLKVLNDQVICFISDSLYILFRNDINCVKCQCNMNCYQLEGLFISFDRIFVLLIDGDKVKLWIFDDNLKVIDKFLIECLNSTIRNLFIYNKNIFIVEKCRKVTSNKLSQRVLCFKIQ